MEHSTEIRKLAQSHVRKLAQILDEGESWKSLMGKIPKVLNKTDYRCQLERNNLPKYNSQHFRLIQNASKQLGKSCTEILFEEWGTSGRIRPALGHLLFLLTEVQEFRAADYVAQEILHTRLPERPSNGPAAIVQFRPDEQSPDHARMAQVLENMSYPSSNLSNMADCNDINLNLDDKSPMQNGYHDIPKIIISEMSNSNNNDGTNGSNMMEFTTEDIYYSNLPMISALGLNKDSDSQLSNSNNNVESNWIEVSDMLKFTGENVSNYNLPMLSALELNMNSETQISTIPSEGTIHSEATIHSEGSTVETESNIPIVSLLMREELTSSIPSESPENLPVFINGFSSTSNESNVDENTPDFGAIMQSETVNSTTSTNSQEFPSAESCYIPAVIDSIGNATKSDSNSINYSQPSEQKITPAVTSSPSSGRHCISPLPNLSLNTQLPHFTYSELAHTTNQFDETPHKNSLEMADSLDARNGRFLGAGSFGSVFLSLGLNFIGGATTSTTSSGQSAINTSTGGVNAVAVKKLHLRSDVVLADDCVTKQFKNEVEILSRYKHDNLLKLLGYSCDGPTYCLLYEYLSGGNLQGRLEKTKEKLDWSQRIKIAQGTARAISYLHTGFSTPLIHRDVKTANILLDCSNNPKLGDFGIVKLSPNANTIVSTTIIGTSIYMAPEAFRSGDVSVKTDSFSFGVVLLELLTALPPFDKIRKERDLISYVEEQCNNTITPLLDIKAGTWMENGIDFADRLYKISEKCLEEKKRRPTMVEVTHLLNKLSEE